MAIALIGGLVASTILTLVALPVLYELSEGLHERVNRRWSEWRAGSTDAAPVSVGDW